MSEDAVQSLIHTSIPWFKLISENPLGSPTSIIENSRGFLPTGSLPLFTRSLEEGRIMQEQHLAGYPSQWCGSWASQTLLIYASLKVLASLAQTWQPPLYKYGKSRQNKISFLSLMSRSATIVTGETKHLELPKLTSSNHAKLYYL